MLANNEVGTIQPVSEIAGRLQGKDIVLHTDAVQALGKIPVDLRELPVDLLSLSAHKFFGPKGIGLLFIRSGTKLSSLLLGGGQEKNRRAGTENVAYIVGMARALELAVQGQEKNAARLRGLQDDLENGLRERIEGIQINGHPEQRIPGLTNVSIARVDGESINLNLDLRGIAASSGSACTSGSVEPSHVLKAMGVTPEMIPGSIRFSLGPENTKENVDLILEVLPEIVRRLRDLSPI
jgi:cysteine desulfurase